jgi:aminopeptidase N
VLDDMSLSRRAVADLLILPDERTLGEMSEEIDVDGVHFATTELRRQIATAGRARLIQAYERNQGAPVADLGNHAVGQRRLMNCALDFLMALGDPEIDTLCLRQLESSSNITEQYRALISLCNSDSPLRERGIESYRRKWQHDQLGLDKWYRAQAAAPRQDTAARVDRLMDSPDFDLSVFSRLFSVTEAFCFLNRYGLHAPGGEGYAVCAKQLVRADGQVPMIATYMFSRSDMPRWRKFDSGRRALMQAAIGTMLEARSLSAGLRDLCEKAAAG